MSTFNGIVSEFPSIRIDYFRHHIDAPPPLACFLSHVHSDHLSGLESFRSPFVYCSAATREILLRLERYPCRINYANGVLEARQQTYKHSAKVLKPLPLETPTKIELCPGQQIQVTLFDANHCLGAVMFLIEDEAKAILYTGDIRSEPWFVNYIARSPTLVAYTAGIKRLDKIYLDTSFTDDVVFRTKAEGIAELLRKISLYPDTTVFHFQAWTYGYEDVWIALSKALASPIHVDDYKLRIYDSLRVQLTGHRSDTDFNLSSAPPALRGYVCGNAPHPGCLTSDVNVRLHSFERGNMCEVAKKASTIIIQPIVAHAKNGDLVEVGVGGGGEDLERNAELDALDQSMLDKLLDMFSYSEYVTDDDRNALRRLIAFIASTGRNISLDFEISSDDTSHTTSDAIRALIKKLHDDTEHITEEKEEPAKDLPRIIHFPYSRHSPYPELCHFIRAFRPKDVWPCTVNPAKWLKEGLSIQSLFGKFCSDDVFEYDAVLERYAAIHEDGERQSYSQMTAMSTQRPDSSQAEPNKMETIQGTQTTRKPQSPLGEDQQNNPGPLPTSQQLQSRVNVDRAAYQQDLQGLQGSASQTSSSPNISAAEADPSLEEVNRAPSRKRDHTNFMDGRTAEEHSGKQALLTVFDSGEGEPESPTRRDAYQKMMRYVQTGEWEPIDLISASSGHSVPEPEL